MVKKSIGVAFLMLVGYWLIIYVFKAHPVTQQQFQTNVIKAQRYIYSDSLRKEDVILGTSISDKFRKDKLPKNIYLLTLPGQSIYDGIAMLKKTNTHPKFIFIEQNSVLTKERETFSSYLFNVPNYYRKKYFPFMQDAYQPVGQFNQFFCLHAGPRITMFTHYIFNPIVSIFPTGKVSAVTKESYYAEAKMQRVNVDYDLVNESFTKLKKEVDELIKTGSTVYFYNVPSDKEIYDSNVAKTIRARFAKDFPRPAYHYLPEPDITKYSTIDQIHMDTTSAKRFTVVIAREIDSVRRKVD